MNSRATFRHLKIACMLVLTILIVGTAGYMFLEKLSFVDAFYTTVDMMATVGNVVHPLTAPGRFFTIFIIIFGVGSLLYTFGVGMEFMLEGQFSHIMRKHIMDKKIATLRQHAIICGFGRVGSQIAEDFAAAHKSFIVIDENERNIQICLQYGYLAVQGDATYDDILQEAGITQAQCVLVATDNDAHNTSITLSARHLNANLFIVARANRSETEVKLKLAGADRVLSPYTIGGHRMANLAFHPSVIEFFDYVTRADNIELAVQEMPLTPTSRLIGRTLADVQESVSADIVIVAVKKQNGLIIGPRLHTLIEEGDTMIVLGAPEKLALLKARHS